ncbi:hypothetical protein DFP78_10556 [Photobacterium lutimaris]|nr:hypothetical protein DFP78_10556 [Photobacterium lutimaris]
MIYLNVVRFLLQSLLLVYGQKPLLFEVAFLSNQINSYHLFNIA